MKSLMLLCAVLVASVAQATVRSYTLGLDVNCPSGLGEWWVPVREGLGRLDGVAFISKYPDLKTATCEVRLEGGRFIDPFSFSNHIFEIRVGARLRGLEAAIDGEIEPNGTNLLFKVSGTNAVLQLAPLTRKVQQNVVAKQPLIASPKETEAFRKLASKLKSKSRRAQIVGPLVRRPDGSLLLEVRSFKLR